MRNNTDNKQKRWLIKPFDLLPRYLALKLYTKRDNVQGMYRNLLLLKPIYKKKPAFYYRLSKLAYRQKKWKQSLDHINNAIQLADSHSTKNLYLGKADILIQLGESAEAVSCLNEYLSVEPNDDQAWYKLAKEHNKLRQWKDAANCFESYLKINPEDSKASFQLAECYRKLSDYQQAEVNYRKATKNIDQNSVGQSLAISYYRLGLMQLKNNNAESAFKSFNNAIELDRELNSQRFGVGAFHEHYKQWEYAIEAYKHQLYQNDKDAELQFKLASLLDKLHRPEQALKYYEQALELDKVRADWHYSLANCYEKLEDYQNAAKWYYSAIARNLKHSPENYRRLGSVLDQLGRSKEALNAYKEAELFGQPSTIDRKIFKDNIKKHKVRYAISYEYYLVNDNIIFYESMGGARMMGNPYAIFEHLLNDHNFDKYTHVWVVNSFQVIPDEFRAMNNIRYVKKGSDAYFKYISSAKYLICNSTFEPYVVRKPDQFYLQTSHGIFYKTVGRDSAANPVGVAGSTRNLLQATHIIVPNEFMAEKQPKSYSINGINHGEIAKVGYPRIDVTLNATDNLKEQIISKLGIDTSKKMVLYAPTWRGSTKANNKFDSTKLINDLKMLAGLDANVVFRGHTISNRLLKEVTLPENIIVPPPELQTNELLSVADILISDYSSVFFDFLVTERPVIHYLYDVEEYTKERGLNLSEDELPGSVAKTSEQLIATVADKLQNDKPDSQYLAAKNRFCPFDDGRSSERVVRWFFYGDCRDISFVDPIKPDNSYLYLGGMLSDKTGIPDLINKLSRLQQNDSVVSIMLEKELTKDKDKAGMLAELNSDINLIAHDKNMPTTPEEAAAINYFQSEGKHISKRMEFAFKRSFKREARRLFGGSQFDQIINYEDNSNYWNALQESIPTTNTLDG